MTSPARAGSSLCILMFALSSLAKFMPQAKSFTAWRIILLFFLIIFTLKSKSCVAKIAKIKVSKEVK